MSKLDLSLIAWLAFRALLDIVFIVGLVVRSRT
jgi:hypothetical protein